MKKPLKIVLMLGGGVAFFVVVLGGLAFTPTVQTWVVRRAVADAPGAKIEVGRAAIGLHSVHLQNLRVTQSGLTLTVPSVELELPVIAAVRGQINLTRLSAKGWTADLTSAAVTQPAKAPTAAFDGIFKLLKLPFALSLADAEIEGDIIQSDGRTHLAVTGGGLGSGKEARFKITTTRVATAADAPIKLASVGATLIVNMDAPNAISRLVIDADATASGPKLPTDTQTHLTASLGRDVTGEIYGAIIRAGTRELVNVEVRLPADGQPLIGKWSLNTSDTDLAPFSQSFPGVILPLFTATGQGTLLASRDLKEITTAGKLAGNLEKLELLRSELSAMGRMEFTADFDLRLRGAIINVTRLIVRLGGAQPVVTAETLQAFEFDGSTRAITPTDPTTNLARIELKAAPLAWAQPFLTGLKISQGRANGVIEASARDGNVITLSATALDVAGMVMKDSQTYWQGRVIVTIAAAEYAPQGWRATVPTITISTLASAAASLLLTNVQVSQSSAAGQPLKVTAAATINSLAILPVLSPVLGAELPISAGAADLYFAANLGQRKEVSAKLAVRGLMANSNKQTLPDATLDVRADIAADGSISLNAPVTLIHGAQKSDFTLGGKFTPNKADHWQIDAQAAGNTIYVQDLMAFADLKSAPAVPAKPDAAPPWAGVTGTVKFAFQKVIFSSDRESSLAGTLTFDGSGPRIEARGALDGTAPAPFVLKGGVTHTVGTTPPYALTADATLTDFSIGAFGRTLEANVNLAVSLTSRAASLDELAAQAQGRFQLTSKGGVTRLLAGIENEGIRTGVAVLGVVAGVAGLGGGNTTPGNAAKVIARITELLKEIRFDQLNVSLSRGSNQDLVIEELSLISPEVRLAGRGLLRHVADKSLADLPLSLRFQMAARGGLAEAMRGVNLVTTKADALGYFPLTFEPELRGSLAHSDTSGLYGPLRDRVISALAGSAGESAGAVIEGASGLFKSLLGK